MRAGAASEGQWRASRVIGDWIRSNKHQRPHQAPGGTMAPDEAHALATWPVQTSLAHCIHPDDQVALSGAGKGGVRPQAGSCNQGGPEQPGLDFHSCCVQQTHVGSCRNDNSRAGHEQRYSVSVSTSQIEKRRKPGVAQNTGETAYLRPGQLVRRVSRMRQYAHRQAPGKAAARLSDTAWRVFQACIQPFGSRFLFMPCKAP